MDDVADSSAPIDHPSVSVSPYTSMTPSATLTNGAVMPVDGSASTAAPLTMKRGIYVPVLTFFKPDAAESLDRETYYKHVQYVAKAGCAGIVALGSTGERVSLSEEERDQVISTARSALDDAGFHSMPLIVGAGDHSIRGAVASVCRAHRCGATHVLVLPSSYYPAQLGKQAILDFYTQLAAASPVPILIYSYPGVSAGIVMDSETIGTLARLPNIVGVKHTDHDIGKMARHCALADQLSKQAQPSAFTVLGGASDYLIGALAVGAVGTITGMANMAPRTVVRVQQLWDQGKYDEARALQHVVSCAEWELGKGGVPIHKVRRRGTGIVVVHRDADQRSAICPAGSHTIRSRLRRSAPTACAAQFGTDGDPSPGRLCTSDGRRAKARTDRVRRLLSHMSLVTVQPHASTMSPMRCRIGQESTK